MQYVTIRDIYSLNREVPLFKFQVFFIFFYNLRGVGYVLFGNLSSFFTKRRVIPLLLKTLFH